VARAASFEVIYNFPDETSQIRDPLAVDSAGRLYGSFSYETSATTFVLTPPAAGSSAWTASEPFQFGQTPTAGSDPAGVLTPKKTVVLGTTAGGGVYGYGTAYRLSGKNQDDFTALHAFAGAASSSQDGASPDTGLTLGAGNLYYGATSDGGISTPVNGGFGVGTVFSMNASTTNPKYTVLHRFVGTINGNSDDGAFPNRAQLAVDSHGNVFGTTGAGGANDLGIVYEMHRENGGWKEKIIYAFTAAPNVYSTAGNVVVDSADNVYGCAPGGAYGFGGVYRLSPPAQPGGAWTETILNSFGPLEPSPETETAIPGCSLTLDASTGRLFGVSAVGGIYDKGSIFELDPPEAGKTVWTRSVIHSFTGNGDGSQPVAAPLQVGGNYYGGTISGTVYEFTP